MTMLVSQSKFVEKKSKFIGRLYELSSEEEIQAILESVRKDHKKAAHICYAYIFGGEEVFKNDGEVGSPGKVLLELLKGAEIHNHVLVVVRYFGGIKLGPGGVARAFRQAGKLCVS